MRKTVKTATKLAFAAVVAAMLSSAEAASVSYTWQVANVVASIDSNLASGTYTAYFFTLTDAGKYFTNHTTEEAILAEINKGNAGDLNKITKRGTATSVVSDEGATATFTLNQSFGNDSWTPAISAATCLAVILDSTSLATAKHYMFAKTSDGSTIATATAPDGNEKAMRRTWTWDADPNNTWVAIPEPTGGVLVLVGVAALALKRKRIA